MSNTKPFFKRGSLLTIHIILHGQGPKQTVQSYQGLCIRKKNQGIDSSFTIKHLVNNESILQTFPLFSPFIRKIQVVSALGKKKTAYV